MFGVAFEKFSPMTYVVHYKAGRVKKEGQGLSFFHYAPTSSILAVPLESVDLPFVFHSTTADFQELTIQGQIIYRVAEPKRTASLLDFTAGLGRKASEKVQDKLGQRLVNEAQTASNAFVLGLPLREVLKSPQLIAGAVMQGLSSSAALQELGVEPMSVNVLSLQPTPEMARALEAEAREALQMEADRAIYERRDYAVEQERKIKENELNTEIAVEQKRQTIRETQMRAEIAVEEQRQSLLERRLENDRKEIEAKAYAMDLMLKPLAGLDWRTLLVLGKGGLDPASLIGLAFQDMAANAQKIGNLNVSSELLESLLKGGARK